MTFQEIKNGEWVDVEMPHRSDDEIQAGIEQASIDLASFENQGDFVDSFIKEKMDKHFEWNLPPSDPDSIDVIQIGDVQPFIEFELTSSGTGNLIIDMSKFGIDVRIPSTKEINKRQGKRGPRRRNRKK